MLAPGDHVDIATIELPDDREAESCLTLSKECPPWLWEYVMFLQDTLNLSEWHIRVDVEDNPHGETIRGDVINNARYLSAHITLARGILDEPGVLRDTVVHELLHTLDGRHDGGIRAVLKLALEDDALRERVIEAFDDFREQRVTSYSRWLEPLLWERFVEHFETMQASAAS